VRVCAGSPSTVSILSSPFFPAILFFFPSSFKSSFLYLSTTLSPLFLRLCICVCAHSPSFCAQLMTLERESGGDPSLLFALKWVRSLFLLFIPVLFLSFLLLHLFVSAAGSVFYLPLLFCACIHINFNLRLLKLFLSFLLHSFLLFLPNSSY
jgi:hypothetical protein